MLKHSFRKQMLKQKKAAKEQKLIYSHLIRFYEFSDGWICLSSMVGKNKHLGAGW